MNLINEFRELWLHSDAVPDVFAFLAEHPHGAPDERMAVLLYDQQQRWKSKSPLRVEAYVAKFPELPLESVFTLVIGEFESRRDLHSAPDLEELTSRFPELSNRLRESLSPRNDQRTDESRTGMTHLATNFSSDAMVQQRPLTQSSDFSLGDKVEGGTAALLTRSYVTQAKVGDHRRGRYRLVRTLGQGGYGVVYLAVDEELKRQVAVKVPTTARFHRPADIESYLSEARMVASLDHPNIVPVYDVGRTDEGSIYVVSKLIDGCTLTGLIGSDFPLEDMAEKLIAPIAIALDYAHRQRLIHRDVKPSNILLENHSGIPYLADFGLAIRVEDYWSDGRIAGTPAYMSPESARGEGHRLDGRSDIFSLAAVFYELLTTKQPFYGSTRNEIYHQVISVDPIRPRDINERIPPELERICLKALSKRASDRYATAADFADDLLNWRGGVNSEKLDHKIVPKGLRSFDANDADFFLELLPGPRDRQGLPASIQFWKTRIEEVAESADTFSVGLVYGPSGCGKSSLVKAGLLPRLSQQVVALYVEATPDDTEMRIIRGLRKLPVGLPHDLGLVDAFSWLRRREGKKVLIVIDQFEQWLHAHRVESDTDLLRALRQCDGVTLQALVMVRDDFAMAAARFMDKIEVPILQGHNFATVDLFDEDHAERVLTKFGQAFGKLPSSTSRLSAEEAQFVKTVAAGLSVDGKVVSVRLALFAEMIKSKHWVPSTLHDVGGTQGIGANFLEETFSSRTANPSHRLHEAAARKVLQALLPEVGTDIKGHMRSQAELAAACGYQDHNASFNDLMRILDGELRLITPTDPEGFRTESGSEMSDKYYQLTHDYLVQALRTWLQRKQLETRRGRAEIRLAQRSAMWSAKPENRQLPSLWEYIPIVVFTSRSDWTQAESQMMAIARRFYGSRLLLGCLLAAVLLVGSVTLTRRINESRERIKVDGLIDQLLVAKSDDLHKITLLLENQSVSRLDRLRLIAADPQCLATDRLRAHYVLNRWGGEHSALLIRESLSCDPTTLKLVRDRLTPFNSTQIEQLWDTVKDMQATAVMRLRASALLATADPSGESWPSISPQIVKILSAEQSPDRDAWVELLRPVAESLMPHWKAQFMDHAALQSDRVIAASVLSKLADSVLLTELLLNAEPNQFPSLMQGVSQHETAVVATMRNMVEENIGLTRRQGEQDRRLLNAAITLVQLGHLADNDSILRVSPDPSLRSRFIVQLHDYDVDPEVLLKTYSEFSDPTARQAVLLALASYREDQVPAKIKQRGTQQFERLLSQSPFASERSAAELLLRRWGNERRIEEIHNALSVPVTNAADWLREHNWWVNSEQHVMCAMGPHLQFSVGSPADEFMRDDSETLVDITIPYRFAVANHEVSIHQFERFRSTSEFSFINSTGTNLPANKISLVQAMQYCRWLSEREGVAEDQMCYPAVDEITLDDSFLTEEQRSRTGYRLLTETEWEGVCRAASTTTWFTGTDASMMNHFSCGFLGSENGPNSIGRMLPNAWGVFDMAGNMLEWCEASAPHRDYAQKGGNFKQSVNNFRSARRYAQTGTSYSYNGFRIACTLPPLEVD